MNNPLKNVINSRLQRTAKALEANNMTAFVVGSRQEAYDKVKELLCEGDSIGVGGSVTLDECGISELIRDKKYRFIDRYEKGLNAEQIRARHIEALAADVYLTSCNAVTEKGELYNVDGNANRIAAIAFGPRSVIAVVGYNKITSDLDEAIKRVKRMAAPANAKRLKITGYCGETGECMSCRNGVESEMTAGCHSEGRICCDYLVCAQQRQKGRIKVILVAEELGF